MLMFHTTVHARPAEALLSNEIELKDRKFHTLFVPQNSLATPLPISFEAAAESLAELPRMFVEPDGSFVWTSSQGQPKWQIDGNLFDRDGRLLFVDLKGSCPADELNNLLSCFGAPGTPRMFQLLREAVFLGEAEFRRYAEM
jgi:hypothetical protein